MTVEWDDVLPTDRPMCFRFGSGAFPCGEPYKVRVTKSTRVNPRREVVTRRVVCRNHYDQQTGGPVGSTIKLNAKNDAFSRLAAAHHDEFQALYIEALARLGFTSTGERVASVECNGMCVMDETGAAVEHPHSDCPAHRVLPSRAAS